MGNEDKKENIPEIKLKLKSKKIESKSIKWCEEHNASTGESLQNDDFQIDAPDFMARAIDKIVMFETEWVS